jgi:hypothetical protein
MLFVVLKKHEEWPHACVFFCFLFFFVLVSQLTENPPEANFPVAETFMNNVPNGASRKIKPYLQYSHVCLHCCINILNKIADVDGRALLCSSITFTRPLSNSLHRLHTCCTVITLAPYTVTSSRWISTGRTFFAHKNRMTEHFFFCPLFQYGRHCAVSAHITWGGDYYCCLVVIICINWTHACQLNTGILSAGIK